MFKQWHIYKRATDGDSEIYVYISHTKSSHVIKLVSSVVLDTNWRPVDRLLIKNVEKFYFLFDGFSYVIAPVFSTPAFSIRAIYSCIFHSCIFHPCDLLLYFPLLHFPSVRSTPAFSTPAFSTPAFSTPAFSAPPYVVHFRSVANIVCRKLYCRLFKMSDDMDH